MKHYVSILTLLTLTLFSIPALSLTVSTTIIESAAQSGNKLLIEANNSATSDIPGYFTVAIGYSITCGSDPVIAVERSSTSGYSGSTRTITQYKSFNAKPQGYDYWPADQTCGISAKGLGGVGGTQVGVSISGSGFQITMAGGSSDTDYDSVHMIADCPPI